MQGIDSSVWLCPIQGITTAIAMIEGLGSPLFATALAFTVVVMYDAMGVRRHAGERSLCMGLGSSRLPFLRGV